MRITVPTLLSLLIVTASVGSVSAASKRSVKTKVGPGNQVAKLKKAKSNRRTIGFKRVFRDKKVTLRAGEKSINIRTGLMDAIMVKSKSGEWKLAPMHYSSAKGSALYRLTPGMKTVQLRNYGVGGKFKRVTPREVLEISVELAK